MVCVTLLLIIKIHISERYAKKLPVPIPTELLIVSLYFQYRFNFSIFINNFRWCLVLLFHILLNLKPNLK